MAGTITDRRTGASSAGASVDRLTGTSGAVAVKPPVKATSSAAIALSGEQTVDGVALVDGDRCLVNGQADATTNGIYLVSTGEWSRAPDFDDSGDAVKGSFVYVTDGTNAGLYVLTTANDVEIGADNISFSNLTALVNGALLAVNSLSDVASPSLAWDAINANGATIIAAATLDLEAPADGNCVDVSGNTGISAVTLDAGHMRLVRFTGAPTITVGASLIGNAGGANIAIEAGDYALFRGYAGGVVRFIVFRASGEAVAATETATFLDSAFRVQDDADPTKQFAVQVSGVTAGQTRTMTVPNSNFTPAALDVEDQTIAGGARVTPKDLGNLSGSSITPDPGDRPMQKVTNNGAGSILPGSNEGQYTLLVINTTGAGAITTTGWTLKGDSFDTTTTSKFACSCLVTSDIKLMTITKVA